MPAIPATLRSLVIAALVAGVAWPGASVAAPRASTSYGIVAEVVGGSGGAAASVDYSNQASCDLLGAAVAQTDSYAIAQGFFVPPSPELVVEISGTALGNSTGKVDLGAVKLGRASEARTVTLRNVGDDDLIVDRIGAVGDQAADFKIDAALTTRALAPGAVTTLQVVFAPTRQGTRGADVFVSSNDAYATLFTSELLGEGVGVAYQDWRTSHFTADELANAAISGPTADPDGDGVNNLLEYAFGLDPTDTSRDGLPAMSTTRVDGADYLAISFTRLKISGDLIYTVEASSDLANWSALAPAAQNVVDHGDTETVVARDTVAVGTVPRRFLRVRVTAP